MKYRNIIFDLYGTLIDIRTDEASPAFWKQIADYYKERGAAYESEELRRSYRALVEEERKKAADPLCPEVELRSVFRVLYERKAVSAGKETVEETAAFFRLASLKRLGLYPGVRELLDFLKAQGCRIFLLSNAQSCFTKRELAVCGLTDCFEKIFLSSDYLCTKPSPLFFDALFDETGIRREETVMIGNDAESDIEGALACGIAALYIHQAISPPLKGKVRAEFAVYDGNVLALKEYLARKV